MSPALRKYWRHAALAVQETIAYRTPYMVNMLSIVVTYVVIILIWNAVFATRSSVGGYNWPEMKSYLIISLFMSALVSGSSEYRISRQIRTGNIAVELLRPVDYQKTSLAITLGNSLSEGLLVGVACLGFSFALGPALMPPDALAWLGFGAAVVLSFATKFLLVYVFGLVCFWTTSLMGISWLRKGFTDFFSGALIPLAFFPDWLRQTADWLPFRNIVWIPACAWSGRLQGGALLAALGVSLAWVLVLWFLGRFIWWRAMRKVTIQGG
jgi:ABC-2 type transport system permease protein